MMARPCLRSGLLVVAALAGATVVRAADPTPETLLNARGLKKITVQKSGVYWVVDSEKPVLDKLHQISVFAQKMASAGDIVLSYMQLESEITDWENERINSEEQRDVLNQQISQMPRRNAQERADVAAAQAVLNQTNQYITMVKAELEKRKRLRISDAKMQQFRNDFEKEKKVFLAAETNLRPDYDVAKKDYEAIGEDLAVKQAISSYGTLNKVKSKLGPSPAMSQGIAKMQAIEDMYSPETSPRKTARAKSKSSLKRKAKGGGPAINAGPASAKKGPAAGAMTGNTLEAPSP